MTPIHRLVLELAVLGMVAACATQQASPALQSGGPVRWSGQFKQTGTPTAGIGPATPNRGFGTITVTPLGGTPPSTRVELSINAAVPGGTHVAWGILNGSCGSPAPLITGENEFAPIEIALSGSGSLRTSMAIELDPHATYHANVYWSSRARDISTVMMCANLNVDRR